MKRSLVLTSLLLMDCSMKIKKIAVPLMFMLSSAPAMADTSFTAKWNVIPNDAAKYEYTIVVGDTTSPSKTLWFGRDTVTAGVMSHSFLFSQTGLADTVTQVCAAVKVKDTATGKESFLSNVSCVVGDFTPPAPPAPLNFQLQAD